MQHQDSVIYCYTVMRKIQGQRRALKSCGRTQAGLTARIRERCVRQMCLEVLYPYKELMITMKAMCMASPEEGQLQKESPLNGATGRGKGYHEHAILQEKHHSQAHP